MGMQNNSKQKEIISIVAGVIRSMGLGFFITGMLGFSWEFNPIVSIILIILGLAGIIIGNIYEKRD